MTKFPLRDHPVRTDAELIRKAAVTEGMVALSEAAVRKMLSGENALDEINKIIGEIT